VVNLVNLFSRPACVPGEPEATPETRARTAGTGHRGRGSGGRGDHAVVAVARLAPLEEAGQLRDRFEGRPRGPLLGQGAAHGVAVDPDGHPQVAVQPDREVVRVARDASEVPARLEPDPGEPGRQALTRAVGGGVDRRVADRGVVGGLALQRPVRVPAQASLHV
jgi:hypothetical protein